MPRVISRLHIGILVAVIGIVALTGGATYAISRPEAPGDDSASAGFLRDMVAHHRQAVDMSVIIFEQSEDQAIRTLALDIFTTQQAQVGMMQGWLQAWDLSQTRSKPAMAWMGHPVEGLMPGMATDEQLERLRDLAPDEADIVFLQLMIPHHAAGVDMAQALLDRSDEPLATGMAKKIIASQQAEINMMHETLEERGAEPLSTETDAVTPHTMDMGH